MAENSKRKQGKAKEPPLLEPRQVSGQMKASYHRPQEGTRQWKSDIFGDLRCLEYTKGNKDGSDMYAIVFNGLGGKDLMNSPIPKGMPFGRLGNTIYMKTNVVNNSNTTKGRFPFAIKLYNHRDADFLETWIMLHTGTRNCFKCQAPETLPFIQLATVQKESAAATIPGEMLNLRDDLRDNKKKASVSSPEDEDEGNDRHKKQTESKRKGKRKRNRDSPVLKSTRRSKAAYEAFQRIMSTNLSDWNSSSDEESDDRSNKRQKTSKRAETPSPTCEAAGNSGKEDDDTDEESNYRRYQGSPVQSQRHFWH